MVQYKLQRVRIDRSREAASASKLARGRDKAALHNTNTTAARKKAKQSKAAKTEHAEAVRRVAWGSKSKAKGSTKKFPHGLVRYPR